jgi:hypothetical protein
MDLTPLIQDPSLGIHAYVQSFIQRFAKDVTERMVRVGHMIRAA